MSLWRKTATTFFIVALATATIGGFTPAAKAAISTESSATASLYLSPASGSFPVGSTFSVSIYVNTGGQAINAVEADLTFPPDKLQVVSPSTGKSFVQIWVNQPNYSNTLGTLHYQGALPAPGIATNAGLISTVTFRVMNTGTAAIRFADTSQVLLNDGYGTNALSQMTNGIYTLTVPPPQGPVVTSPTNPDQSTWYKSNSVTLEWTSDKDNVDGYSYVLNDSPSDNPDNVSEGPGTAITYDHVSDGIHYFHIKSLRKGVWGGVTSYIVRIDNTPPASMTLNFSPGDYTASQNVVAQFETTDAASGIDHYEMKIVPLDPGTAQDGQGGTKALFTEVTPPYLLHLGIGRYSVIIRAYDLAGNFTQASSNLTVVNSVFQVVRNQGLRIGGTFVLSWWYLFGFLILLLGFLAYGLRRAWLKHRIMAAKLADGAAAHPEIAAKLEELKQKQREYDEMLKQLVAIAIVVIGAGALAAMPWMGVVRAADVTRLTLNPPIINVYPNSIGNDEILYIGGWANAPDATVEVFIEQSETGNTYSGTATTGSDGNWFYSFPQLLSSGHYAVWATLESGTVESQPSSRVTIEVAPTALQLGSVRLDFAGLFLILFILCLTAAIVLAVLILVYYQRTRRKRTRLETAIRAAEESVRRGFAILHHDIEMELAGVQKMSAQGMLSEDERLREQKLKKHLDDVRRYIGQEIWKIEEEEEK